MPDTAPEATGMSDAVTAIAALLTPDGDTQPPERNPAENPEEGTLEGHPEGEETAEPPVEGDEAPPEETPAEGEDAPEGEPPAPATITVELDGKAVSLTADEVARGYLRQQDYSRKTAEVAERRKAFEATEQSVKQERATYAQLIPALIQRLQSSQPQKPDPALLDSDPVKYFREKAAYDDNAEQLQAAQFEEHRLRQQQTQEQQDALKGRIADERAKMLEAIPHWKDPAKWQADRVKIRDYGKKLGFTEEEIDQAADHRAVTALYKAMRYDELLARQPKPATPKAPRVAAAGSANSAPNSRTTFAKANQRLAQTGRPEDAATALKGLLF